MNRLNPLYIVLLLFTVLFISFFSLINIKKVYSEKLEETNEIQIKAKEYNSLVSYWKNEEFIQKTLDEILKNPLFKNENIVKTETKESIKIRIETPNSQILDSFLNKILNKQLIIKKIELDKNYINLEIGIK